MWVCSLPWRLRYFGVALPVLSRVVGRASPTLVRNYRRDLEDLVERLVLVDAPPG